MRSWPTITTGKRIRPSWFTGLQDAIDELDASVSAANNSLVGTFNVLDNDGVGDGTTDDTVALQATIDAAIAAGGGVVEGVGQRYKISLRDTVTLSGYKYALMVHGDAVKLRNMTLVMDGEYLGGQIAVLVSGHAKAAASFATADMALKDVNFNVDTNFPVYTINAAAYLAKQIVLASAGDAANFAVGDYIYIRSGQLLPIAGEGQPDAEINRIVEISGANLLLAYPLSKPFVQEYFADADRDSVTTTSVTAHLAHLGVANVNAAIIRGFATENVHFEITADTYGGIALATTQVVDVSIEASGDLKDTDFQNWGPHRFLTIKDPHVIINRNLSVGTWASGDRGCVDFTTDGGSFSAYGDYGCQIHMNEGCANVNLLGTALRNTNAFDASSAMYAAAGRGYRHAINNSRFSGEGGGTLATFTDIDGVFIDSTDLGRTDSGVSLAFAGDCRNISLGVNEYGNGTVDLHPSATTGAAEVTPRVLSAWAHWNSAGGEVVLGTLPVYATVLDVKILVHTAFDGGSPTIQLAYVMDAAADVSAQGYATISLTPYEQWLDSVPRLIEAFITPDGSTAGKAQCIVTYINGPIPS